MVRFFWTNDYHTLANHADSVSQRTRPDPNGPNTKPEIFTVTLVVRAENGVKKAVDRLHREHPEEFIIDDSPPPPNQKEIKRWQDQLKNMPPDERARQIDVPSTYTIILTGNTAREFRDNYNHYLEKRIGTPDSLSTSTPRR